jgi:hypothetical protein
MPEVRPVYLPTETLTKRLGQQEYGPTSLSDLANDDSAFDIDAFKAIFKPEQIDDLMVILST